MEGVLDVILTNLPLILCLIAGVGLLVLEVFVPGFGLPGVSGLILLSAGIVITWRTYGPVAGLAVTLIALPVDHEENDALLGKEGITATVLNPVGIAEFDGVRLNVVSEGAYLEKGVKVRVYRVEGAKITVRPIEG